MFADGTSESSRAGSEAMPEQVASQKHLVSAIYICANLLLLDTTPMFTAAEEDCAIAQRSFTAQSTASSFSPLPVLCSSCCCNTTDIVLPVVHNAIKPTHSAPEATRQPVAHRDAAKASAPAAWPETSTAVAAAGRPRRWLLTLCREEHLGAEANPCVRRTVQQIRQDNARALVSG